MVNMRKILVIVFLLVSYLGFSQKLQHPTTFGMEYDRLRGTMWLGLPKDTFAITGTYRDSTWIAVKGLTIYLWNPSTYKWDAATGGAATDTTSLSNRINLKLNISDTANMLLNYINGVGYALLKTGQTVRFDSATAAAYFLRRKDSATGTNLNGYLTRSYLSSNIPTLRQVVTSGQVALTGHRFFVGDSAGYNVPSFYSGDSMNVNAFGNHAGYDALRALGSNFIGYYSGYEATDAHNANFFGRNSGYEASGANESVFIGDRSGYQAYGANNSFFFGTVSGYQAENANVSQFIGDESGYQATNANSSNFFGYRAGYQATNASTSNFFGYRSGKGATSADGSNFFGYQTGEGATGAFGSNFSGYQSGQNATGALRSNFFGANSGQNAIYSSYSNLFGYRVGFAFSGDTLGSNNIIMGTNISLPNGSANMLNLGGVLFGTNLYSTTTGNPKVNAVTTGKIGIAVPAPDSMLTVLQGIYGQRGVRFPNLPSGKKAKQLYWDTDGTIYQADSTTGSGGGSTNIYNTDGTLTGDRTVSGAGHSLTIDNTNVTTINGVSGASVGSVNVSYTAVFLSSTNGGANYSEMGTLPTGIAINPDRGLLNIDTLANGGAFVDSFMVRTVGGYVKNLDGSKVVSTTTTQTLTNKRWTPRVGSTTSSATPTINTDNVDIYKLTAQAADITSMTTNLSGTPVDGDVLEIQITGTAARGITWGTSFVSSTVTLPTTTVTTATLTVILQYYTTSSYGNNKWVCVNYY